MRQLLQSKNFTRPYKIVWAIYWIALLVFYLLHTGTMLGEVDEGRLLRTDGYVLLFFAMAASFLYCTFYLRPRIVFEEDGKQRAYPIKPWYLVLLPVNALFCFWIVEYVNNDQFRDIEPFYIWINILGIVIMHFLLLGWFNSLSRAVIAGLCIWAGMAITFYLVYEFRGEPFQLIDYTNMRTAFTVTGRYHIDMPRSFVVNIVLWMSIMAIYIHMPCFVLIKKGVVRKILLRVLIFACMVGGYFFYFNTSWNAKLHIKTDLFAPIKTYKKYGSTLGLFCVGKYMRLLPPEGYTVSGTAGIAARAEENTTSYSTTDVRPVNIIAIMNEAWADYSYAGDLNTNKDPMPYYHSMQEDTIKGYNLVCITGGGTAKTEYEFLTGNSVKRFPGMVPYVSYFRHEQYSLVTTLKAQGYPAIAMHPYKGSNWKRPTAYKLLDFDAFLTEEDFPEDAERIRGHITDRANYEEIIRLIEEKENPEDPFFLFDVTMQNHGGYTKKSYYGDVEFLDYTAEEADDKDAVDRYLSLSKVTDNALMYLIEYFRGVEEPTLIVMFGDHYPTLPDSMVENVSGVPFSKLSFEEQQRYYATPFFIWANYDIPEAENVLTSTNYLGTMMLDQTGLAQAPYNRYLNELMQTMPALNHQGYVTKEGNMVRWTDAEEPYRTLEWEYECLQYNNLAEKRERLVPFFTITEEDL